MTDEVPYRPAKPRLSYYVGTLWLKAFGWKVKGGPPGVERAVVIAAPHTTNWDLPFTLAVSYALGLEIRWVGKHTLFKPPFGWFMRWLGGLAVDRRSRNNAVTATADVINAHEELLLIIPPEGTRSKASRWKTGFYWIAVTAKVPIVLGFLDYSKKEGGLGEVLYPTGDIKKDFETIRAFYSNVKGKFPELSGEITVDENAAPPA